MALRKINQNELNEILRLHKQWLRGHNDGVKANLRHADLRGVQLNQVMPDSCWIEGSKWLQFDLPWWLGHPQQDQIILCDE